MKLSDVFDRDYLLLLSALAAALIILAADGIAKLRLPDVDRVMQDFFFTHGSTSELVDYISSHRPDLIDEARACQLELIPA